MAHSRKKPFVCRQCGRGFRRTHIREHTKGKNLICSKCREDFLLKSLVIRHQRTHLL
ncbi:Hypothetical predicted protein [Lynx pardinus]|uniref:C2H2-type domain-containing protein n=1 Tax=Lynx pardinus TaxID=191816 RepID=A0A485MYQ4_LYNPA|nr:Hypothetical predicted protein [Lynx pardinus]